MKSDQNSSGNLIREDYAYPSVMRMPNSMSLAWGYEEHHDLVTSMTYKRGATVVAERGYVYDVLSRPVSRQTTRQGNTVNDSFSYNSRSELIGATVNGKLYGYSYDNIGNRKTAQEDAEEVTAYTANPLNQYTAIQQGNGEEDEADTFTPTYDANGNQTRIRTATGIWNVTYNAENRPIRFESEDGASVIDCTYDYMGRRHTRKVTVNGAVNSYLRYIYRGYLQIAAIDAVSGVFRWFLFWDPTQPTATRPLAIRKDQTWYAYGWDLTKNVTEVFGKAGYLRTAYTYTPYGTATATGDVTQPFTWSSEYSDEELALIYYNYRHYNPTDGRWISRDPIAEQGGWNLYAFVRNMPLSLMDLLGLADIEITLQRILETEWETVSEWVAVSHVSGCLSVSGMGIELKKGTYALKKEKNYSSQVKSYPIPAGEYAGRYLSTTTSLIHMVKSLKESISNERKESKLFSDKNVTARENFNRSLQRYESFCDLKKWLCGKPNMPDYVGIPVQRESEEESRMLKFNEINTHELGLLNVPNFQGIRFHAGTTFADSRGCIIIGEQIIDGNLLLHAKNTPNIPYADDILSNRATIKVKMFYSWDSLKKAEELSKFFCCVKQKKGGNCSISVKILDVPQPDK